MKRQCCLLFGIDTSAFVGSWTQSLALSIWASQTRMPSQPVQTLDHPSFSKADHSKMTHQSQSDQSPALLSILIGNSWTHLETCSALCKKQEFLLFHTHMPKSISELPDAGSLLVTFSNAAKNWTDVCKLCHDSLTVHIVNTLIIMYSCPCWHEWLLDSTQIWSSCVLILGLGLVHTREGCRRPKLSGLVYSSVGLQQPRASRAERTEIWIWLETW